MKNSVSPTDHSPASPVASLLQDVIARASTAIAGRENWGRTELEILRRDLIAACDQARAERRAEVVARMALADLCAGVESGVANLVGAADAARRVAGQAGVLQ